MRYRKLSPSGDYVFGNGSLDFLVNTPGTVAQAVETSLLLFQGEWYLDTTAGVPYLEGVVGKHSQDQADATLKSSIQNVQGVLNLIGYESTFDPVTRKYSSISGTLNTIYGETELQIENQGNF